MKMNLVVLLAICIVVGAPAFSQKNVRIVSPDGNIKFEIGLVKGGIQYTVAYKGKTLIKPSSLSLDFENGSFGKNLKLGKVNVTSGSENYTLLVGKAKDIIHPYRVAILPFTENVAPYRKVNIAVKVFNDGAAFRYIIPEQANWDSYVMLEEKSAFNVVNNPKIRTLVWGSYNTSHEGFYEKRQLSEFSTDSLMDMPALVEFPGNVFMGITEAGLRNYAGMYLKRNGDGLISQLSPLQGQSRVKVKATLPHQTPWRVMLISDRIGALVESNMITSLNEKQAEMDWSWLKPGKTTFHWWNGDIVPDTSFEPGFNFEFNKYYIDFCAKNNIQYHAVIGYGGHPWYVNDGSSSYQPGPGTDVTKVVPGFDMAGVCSYAASKGVNIHTWVHWAALYPKIDEAFTLMEKWGIKGMMVDFMDRDDQEMVNIQEEILQKAAKHKLYIQFHGAFKPTGLHRTYPNEFTREGTLNYENNKWLPQGLSPDHDMDMPFTRLLAGAADYHLGGFRAVPAEKFKTQFSRPLMVGTRAHMLAMYVVLESYLASLCDFPAAYEGQPGFSFLQKVPTTWNETKVIDAQVDEFIITARRKDDDWYVGSITNHNARSIKIPLTFLSEGNYTAEIFSDAADTGINPNHLLIENKEVNRNSVIDIKLNSGGGMVIHLNRK